MDDTIQQWPSLAPKSISRSDSATYYYCKRILDTVVVLLAVVFLAPIILIVAVLIKLDSPGPAFFIQERVGSRRRVRDRHVVWEIQNFKIYKFRSMTYNADESIHRAYIREFVRQGGQKNASPKTTYKLTNDPRVTRMGRLLRKTSLDELPQLINVLRGEMSLVGPRPVPEYEVSEYREAWHYDRLATLPGITGLWQVKGRCQVEFEEMIRLDLEYIRRQSLWLDLQIILLTIPAVLSGKGAE